MIPQKLPIKSWTEGDRWKGIPTITMKTGLVGGPMAPPASALVSATMRFKKVDSGCAAVVELSSADADQITIVSAPGWEISIPAQIIPGLTAGKWAWQLKTIDALGGKDTWLGDSITILETV